MPRTASVSTARGWRIVVTGAVSAQLERLSPSAVCLCLGSPEQEAWFEHWRGRRRRGSAAAQTTLGPTRAAAAVPLSGARGPGM